MKCYKSNLNLFESNSNGGKRNILMNLLTQTKKDRKN